MCKYPHKKQKFRYNILSTFCVRKILKIRYKKAKKIGKGKKTLTALTIFLETKKSKGQVVVFILL